MHKTITFIHGHSCVPKAIGIHVDSHFIHRIGVTLLAEKVKIFS